MPLQVRQWPEVYDLCHTFLHVARVRKHTDMPELHAFVFWLAQRAKTCDKISYLWLLPIASSSEMFSWKCWDLSASGPIQYFENNELVGDKRSQEPFRYKLQEESIYCIIPSSSDATDEGNWIVRSPS